MSKSQMYGRLFVTIWTAIVLILLYVPIFCNALASVARGRYFVFPIRSFSADWWQRVINSIEIQSLLHNSLIIAAFVTLFSVGFAFTGALAFARYNWPGRKFYQRLLLLPIFFPQPVLGLALLLFFNTLGLQTSWRTAIFAHLVWVVPVVTLVMAIQVYGFDPTLEEAALDLGCSRWQVWREVTLPLLWPGIWSGMLFAFLLSWSNFALSLYTSGADSTIPKWLYSKMVAGYTPMVPALGTMATLGAATLLILSYSIIAFIRTARRNSISL